MIHLRMPLLQKPDTSGSHIEPSKANPQLATRHEIASWQSDSEFILEGYRRENGDYCEVVRSLTYMHNETCSIYTHLVPALLLPLAAPNFLNGLSGRAGALVLDTGSMDYAMFAVFFCCAETCLGFSAMYHLVQPHSRSVELFWHGMDLLGIVIVTVGTFASGIYFVFFGEESLQRLHWATVLTTGTVAGVLIAHPLLRTPPWRNVKTATFVMFGSSALLPLAHGVRRYGFDYMFHFAGMKWYLLELAFYGGGVVLYAV